MLRLSIHRGVLVMYVIVIVNNGRASCIRTSGNPEFRQSSAELDSAENLQNRTE